MRVRGEEGGGKKKKRAGDDRSTAELLYLRIAGGVCRKRVDMEKREKIIS